MSFPKLSLGNEGGGGDASKWQQLFNRNTQYEKGNVSFATPQARPPSSSSSSASSASSSASTQTNSSQPVSQTLIASIAMGFKQEPSGSPVDLGKIGSCILSEREMFTLVCYELQTRNVFLSLPITYNHSFHAHQKCFIVFYDLTGIYWTLRFPNENVQQSFLKTLFLAKVTEPNTQHPLVIGSLTPLNDETTATTKAMANDTVTFDISVYLTAPSSHPKTYGDKLWSQQGVELLLDDYTAVETNPLLNKLKGVLKQGLLQSEVGARRLMVCPSHMAYGSGFTDDRFHISVPPNATVIIEMDVRAIRKPAPPIKVPEVMKTPVFENVRKSEEDNFNMNNLSVNNLGDSGDRKKDVVRRMARLSGNRGLLNRVVGGPTAEEKGTENENEKPDFNYVSNNSSDNRNLDINSKTAEHGYNEAIEAENDYENNFTSEEGVRTVKRKDIDEPKKDKDLKPINNEISEGHIVENITVSHISNLEKKFENIESKIDQMLRLFPTKSTPTDLSARDIISCLNTLHEQSESNKETIRELNERLQNLQTKNVQLLEKNQNLMEFKLNSMTDLSVLTEKELKEKQIEQMKQELQNKDKKIDELQIDCQTKDKKIKDLQTESQDKETKIKELQMEYQEKTEENKQLQLQCQDKDEKAQGLQMGLQEKEDQLKQLQTECHNKDTQIKQLQKDCQDKDEQVQQLQEDCQNKHEQINQSHTEAQNKQTLLETIKKELESLKTTRKSLEMEKTQTIEELQQLQNEKEQWLQEKSQLIDKCSELETENERFQEEMGKVKEYKKKFQAKLQTKFEEETKETIKKVLEYVYFNLNTDNKQLKSDLKRVSKAILLNPKIIHEDPRALSERQNNPQKEVQDNATKTQNIPAKESQNEPVKESQNDSVKQTQSDSVTQDQNDSIKEIQHDSNEVKNDSVTEVVSNNSQQENQNNEPKENRNDEPKDSQHGESNENQSDESKENPINVSNENQINENQVNENQVNENQVNENQVNEHQVNEPQLDENQGDMSNGISDQHQTVVTDTNQSDVPDQNQSDVPDQNQNDGPDQNQSDVPNEPQTDPLTNESQSDPLTETQIDPLTETQNENAAEIPDTQSISTE